MTLLEKNERFHYAALSYIIDHFEAFKPFLRSHEEEDLSKLRRYIAGAYLSPEGHHVRKVSYARSAASGNRGRYFAVNGLSLQGMPREIRNAIAYTLYDDLDFHNCHPSLLMQYCAKNNIEANLLKTYCLHRDRILSQCSKKDAAKTAILAVIYGGSCDPDKRSLAKEDLEFNAFLSAFGDEMKVVRERIAEMNPEFLRIAQNKSQNLQNLQNLKHNVLGSALCLLLGDLENDALMALCEFVESHLHRKVGAYVFDGCMVEKSQESPEVREEDLERASAFVFEKTSYKLSIRVKDMTLEKLPVPLEVYEPKTEGINNDLNNDQAMTLASKILSILSSPYRVREVKEVHCGECGDDVVIRASLVSDFDNFDDAILRLSMSDLRVTVIVNDKCLHDQYIHKDQAIEIVGYDPASIHKDIKSGLDWCVTRPCDNKALFKSSSDATIELLNFDRPGHESIRVDLSDMRKTSRLTNKRDIAGLHAAYQGALKNAAIKKLDIGFLVVGNNNIIINNESPDATRNSDVFIINALISQNPGLYQRLKFVPDKSSSNCNGLYLCDSVTNIWTQRHNAELEEILSIAFSKLDCLSDVDKRHVHSRRGGGDMLHMMARKCVDGKLADLLDASLDIFALDNGCFDSSEKSSRPVFRPLKMDDYVSTTAGWSYDILLAKAHRKEVDEFFEKVMPIPEERHILLAYFASLLSGRREAKKFIVLTDFRSGNNGKSTLLNLMKAFFGNMVHAKTSFVCKSSFGKDKDSHDGGLEPLKGKRLIIAEELKGSMTLDEALLKQYAGGAGVDVEGRCCGSGKHFKYTWQAGFALAFNEGDCPKFDQADGAFMSRMMIAPARAKFVSSEAKVNGFNEFNEFNETEPWTFDVDWSLATKFPDWRSSVADVLLEHFQGSPQVFEDLPHEMSEWRRAIANSEVSAWCEEHLIVTGLRADAVSLTDLLQHAPDSWIRSVRAYFEGVPNVSYIKKTCIKGEDKRNVLRGVRNVRMSRK